MRRPSRQKAPQRKKRQRGKYRASGPACMTVNKGRIVFLLPRRLRSPNFRSHWRAEHGDKQAWLKLIEQAESALLATATWRDIQQLYGADIPVVTRMKMEILRLAPNHRYMMDNDNLHASVKRLQDAIHERGYLVDDNNQWLESHIVQGVSDDKKYWTIVTLSRSDKSTVYNFPVVSARQEAIRRLQAASKKVTWTAARLTSCSPRAATTRRHRSGCSMS